MPDNQIYRKDDDSLLLLLTKQQAATALGVSIRVLEALERRGDIHSVSIAPCFPKQNPTAKSRRGPQPMKRFPLSSLKNYVRRLQEMQDGESAEDEFGAARASD